MLTDYLAKQLERAHYKILEDGSIFAAIPRLKGVWASGKTVEATRQELREVLEDWLVLKLRDRESIAGLKITHDQHRLAQHA